MAELSSLRLFNEKAEKLLSTRFVKYLKATGKLSVGISANGEEERLLPDQDAIDAFVLTFRFFIQDNEKSSFRQLSKTYEKMPISSELKKKFADWRKALNDYLDKKIRINLNGNQPSHRELLGIFIYGGLAHANIQKKAIYDSWKTMGFVHGFLEFEFCCALETVLRAICGMTGINKQAIMEIEK
jgi:hypothetical protein